MLASLTNTLLRSNGAMWHWSGHCRSFIRIIQSCSSIVLLRCVIAHSCNFRCATHFVHVRRLEFSQSVIFAPLSYVIQIQIFNRLTVTSRGSYLLRPLRSILFVGFKYVRHQSLGLPDRLQQCIQPATSDVNFFLLFTTTLFITFRSSYNVLCYHTMLAGATWGIKCDKQALPLRPVF
jgi:hypothetical protein